MKIKKYRPAFFTGFPDEEYEVNSKQELLDSGLCPQRRKINMKTRLLRKLRKEARALYWIEYSSRRGHGRYAVRCRKQLPSDPFVFGTDSSDLAEVKNALDELRRRFILDRVEKEQRRRGKYKIDY